MRHILVTLTLNFLKLALLSILVKINLKFLVKIPHRVRGNGLLHKNMFVLRPYCPDEAMQDQVVSCPHKPSIWCACIQDVTQRLVGPSALSTGVIGNSSYSFLHRSCRQEIESPSHCETIFSERQIFSCGYPAIG